MQASQQNILMHLPFKHRYIYKQPDEGEVCCSSSTASGRANWSTEGLGLELTYRSKRLQMNLTSPSNITENKDDNYFPFFFKSETLRQAIEEL